MHIFRFRKSPFRFTGLLLVTAVLSLFATSCISRKKLTYFQNLPQSDVTFTPKQPIYHLQTGDVIKVGYSGPDPAALAPFGSETTAGQTSTVTNLSVYLTGYSVSDSGTIFLPILGTFKVADKTLNEVEALIQTRLNTYVRNAAVKIRLVSFKISVLGEVRIPGTYYIYNEMLTIPEALGYAGDMSDNADRTQLRIIRRKQGVVTINTIDMTSPDMLGSNNFYLQPNDVLYAVPIKQKADRLNLPTVAIGVSSVTAILVLINIFRN